MKRQEDEVDRRAKSYVDGVLESQRRLGHEPRVSEEDYRRAVGRAAAAFANIATPQDRPTEDERVPA
jgi:anti-sigma-K factor RskA